MTQVTEQVINQQVREHPLRPSPHDGGWVITVGTYGDRGGGSKLIRMSPLNINVIKL